MAAARIALGAAAFGATLFFFAGRGRAEPVTRDWPCKGCLLAPSPSGGAAPLLVVLHGDEGTPARMFEAWRAIAAERGVTLFAPRCPKDKGCAGSFWQWDGDPSWLFEQLDVLASRHGIDPDRRYLAGWSGGATWATMRARRWGERFAALSVAGGGVPPTEPGCSPCPYPVLYLMGDKNPLFNLAEGARAGLTACGHDVAWTLLPGANHGAEWRAYSAPAALGALLDRLLATPRRACEGPSDAGAADSQVGAAPSSSAAPGLASSAAVSQSREPREGGLALSPPPSPRCSCEMAGARFTGSSGLFSAALALALAARRRMAKK